VPLRPGPAKLALPAMPTYQRPDSQDQNVQTVTILRDISPTAENEAGSPTTVSQSPKVQLDPNIYPPFCDPTVQTAPTGAPFYNHGYPVWCNYQWWYRRYSQWYPY
jgi:hypothetical protein